MNVRATEEATTIRTRLEGGKIWEPEDILSRPAAAFVPASVGRTDRVQWFACSTLRSGSSSVNVEITIFFEQQSHVLEETDRGPPPMTRPLRREKRRSTLGTKLDQRNSSLDNSTESA